MPDPRPFAPTDLDVLVDLSIRTWTPVFATLGDEVFLRLHPDWVADQTAAVRDTCTSGRYEVHVVHDPQPVGFVAFAPDLQPGMGVIEMVAVDPDRQRDGIGTRLVELAARRLHDLGMDILVVETGGNPGHAPARALFSPAGSLTSANYWRLRPTCGSVPPKVCSGAEAA